MKLEVLQQIMLMESMTLELDYLKSLQGNKGLFPDILQIISMQVYILYTSS